MKKLLYVLSLALPVALISNISTADAQRKNHTDKDVPAKVETMEPQAQMPKHEMKKMDEHGYKMHKMHKRTPEQWLNKENAEINEDYQEAVEKVNKSTLPQDYKDLLLKQAESNKAFAMKQAKAKSEVLRTNWEARKKFSMEMMKDKPNRKAVKEVDDII